MSVHLSMESLDRYRRRQLDPEELLAADDHLATCQSCRQEALAEEPEEEIVGAVKAKLAEPEGEASVVSISSAWAWRVTAVAATLLLIAAIAVFVVTRTERSGELVIAIPKKESPREIVRDGGRSIQVQENGIVTGLESLPESERAAIRQALVRGMVEVPASIAELNARPGTLMGATDAKRPFELLSPVGTMVGDDRPTFRWEPLAGATRYVVAVYDPTFNLVTRGSQVTGTSWTPDTALQPGPIYSWQVVAITPEREVVSPIAPAPEARFRVLDRDTAYGVETANAREGEGHLSRAVRYAGAGMLDDAERELQGLLLENPKSELAQQLLRSVEIQRGSVR